MKPNQKSAAFAINAGLVLSLLLTASLAGAAGGGGGGSVPSCTEDVFSCGQWSDCSASGTQTRTCTMTFDCSTANTTSPPQQQNCTPPPTPTPTPTPTNNNLSQPTATPTQPTCSKDTWTCSSWSATCDPNGNQARTCTKTLDCPSAATPAPAISQPCDHLQCGDKTTLANRITCRLELKPAGVARELQLQYLPEECRALKNKDAQETCEDLYKAYKPCWNLPAGQQRFNCARDAIKLGPDISAAIAACKVFKAQYAACINKTTEQVYSMIKFQFYDLEQRAEALWAKGASIQAVSAFETISETQKQIFNQATTTEQRKNAILAVKKAWQDFLNLVRDQIQ